MMRALMLVAVTVLLLISCSSSGPEAVAVLASFRDLEILDGEWTGQFVSAETGRGGSIVFRIDAATQSAAGDLVMVTPPRCIGIELGRDPAQEFQMRVLRIESVRIEGYQISGSLVPYEHPECEEILLSTTFHGSVVSPNVIRGEFVTRSENESTAVVGWWEVKRRPGA